MSCNDIHILLVEDEAHIAEGLKLNLSMQGYAVSIATDGRQAIHMWESLHPDLIILDIMLPVLDGISVLQHIRLEDARIPILALSAKGEPKDKVAGLKNGADDYLSKPFHLEEFLLRVKRLLLRADPGKSEADREKDKTEDIIRFSFGNNSINFEEGTASDQSKTWVLTPQEIKLMKLFIQNQGVPVSREKILAVGWGYSRGMSTRTVDNFIVRFRKYFEKNPKKPEFFISRRSVGYIFNPEGQSSK